MSKKSAGACTRCTRANAFPANKLEQLGFKLEKIIGIWKHAGKVRKELYKGRYVLVDNHVIVHQSNL